MGERVSEHAPQNQKKKQADAITLFLSTRRTKTERNGTEQNGTGIPVLPPSTTRSNTQSSVNRSRLRKQILKPELDQTLSFGALQHVKNPSLLKPGIRLSVAGSVLLPGNRLQGTTDYSVIIDMQIDDRPLFDLAGSSSFEVKKGMCLNGLLRHSAQLTTTYSTSCALGSNSPSNRKKTISPLPQTHPNIMSRASRHFHLPVAFPTHHGALRRSQNDSEVVKLSFFLSFNPIICLPNTTLKKRRRG